MPDSPKTKLALFGCYVTRWKEYKDGRHEAWDEHVAFRAPKEVEHTDGAWDAANAMAGKRWKQTSTSGWEVRELWMERPSNW